MSAAWWTGYVSSSPLIDASPDAAASSLTVGLRCSSATVVSERNGSSSWFSAGTALCANTVVSSGSMPAARLSRTTSRTFAAISPGDSRSVITW